MRPDSLRPFGLKLRGTGRLWSWPGISWPRLAQGLRRLGLAALTMLLALAGPGAADLGERLAGVTAPYAFSLTGWQARALAERLPGLRSLPAAPESPAAVALVQRYYQIGAERRRVQGEQERLYSLPSAERPAEAVERTARQLAALDRELAALRPLVEEIVAAQVTTILAEAGIGRPILRTVPAGGWPLPWLEITPPVAFTLSPLPEALFIAPRDRIAITHTVLIRPGLDLATIERLEDRVEQWNVAAVVNPIGGFAAYPSMVADTDPLPRALEVIAHEWTHHYLAFRPLGRQYFASYEMRTINETVADIVGQEIGRQVYRRYYGGADPPRPAPPPADRSRPDFGSLMRAIRREVEALLARGDIAGAERYMAEQKVRLRASGYYVRRLNTAYLSFFGSYAGGGNPYEPMLRQLRARLPSLAAFLQAVESISRPEDLTGLVQQLR